MSIDTSDYILSKVHDCLENQPTISTVKNERRIQSAGRKRFWKQTSVFLALPLRSESPAPPIAHCLYCNSSVSTYVNYKWQATPRRCICGCTLRDGERRQSMGKNGSP